MRLFTGLFKPRVSIIGFDFAVDIEATGSAVQSVNAGDKLMGFGFGFHAQYFTLPESKTIKAKITMPPNLTYDEAAACLEGSFYGRQKRFCRMQAAVKEDQRLYFIG